jgi:alpha/beta superfamily hydrolase
VGRTSWTGRPEVDDYTSFVALFIHYINNLDMPKQTDALAMVAQSASDDLREHRTKANPVVILGGYSYGSLILQHTPPVPTILQSFHTPAMGTAIDEIVFRARALAGQTNLEGVTRAEAAKGERRSEQKARDHNPGLTMGGDEISPDHRRSSRDVRRSIDRAHSLNIRTRFRSVSHRRREQDGLLVQGTSLPLEAMTIPDIGYLLVSPLAAPASTFAAPALAHKVWSRSRDADQLAISRHCSFAVYGDHDAFTSAKRLREWCEEMKHQPSSQFSSVQIAGAGHFWVEAGVEEMLKAALSGWEADVR